MSKRKMTMSCLIAVALAAAFSAPALADSVVKASLKDNGGMMDLSKSMGLGMGMHGDMSTAIMSIDIDKPAVPAGKVTFEVTNASKETVHEMIVAPVADENAVLPYIESEGRVDEEETHDLGEVSELEGGKSGTLTVDLKPGFYVLYCNIPGHYMAGMWTMLKVE